QAINGADSEDDADDIIDLSQDFDDDTYRGFELYGNIKTRIVGVQYYDGHATSGEFVIVRREPTNQYDANAIRVDNVQRAQIGHIPRQMAAKLAPYMDARDLLVEGLLAGSKGHFDCPITLKLFGSRDGVAKANLIERMKADKLPFDELIRKDKQKAAELKKQKAAELKEIKKNGSRLNMGSGGSQTGLANGSSQGEIAAQSLEDIIEESERFNPREMGEVAEKFGSGEEALSQLPMADTPPELVAQLLPFQRQGLAWMLERENPQVPPVGSTKDVQLWKRSPENARLFTNVATNFTIENRDVPPLASGGILADDMGLGKTIQVISLILTDMTLEKKRHGESGSSMTNLIIAPVSVLSNWSGQIACHIQAEKALRVLTYHGTGKKRMTAKDFGDYDVVITSYGALASEYLPRGSKNPPPIPRKHGLFSINWRRIVLDEGHTIRNPKTRSSAAASALLARSRWALTGTPIVNNLKDLYSLVRFLHVSGGLERLEIFNSVLIRPLNAGDGTANLLLQALMGTFCLRRKKEMAFIDLRLPELTEYVHRINFLPLEKEKYEALEAEAKGILQTYKKRQGQGGTDTLQTYRHLLEILLRLRQVCNHWKLCNDRMTKLMALLAANKTFDLTLENRQALQDMLQLSIDSREDCPLCLDDLHNPVITACTHVFGFECIERTIELQHKCPMCRAELEDTACLVRPAEELTEAPNQPEVDAESSSKVEALLTILKASHRKPGTKVVIFSQWTSFLDVVQHQLAEHGFGFTRIDGTMSATRRDQAMAKLESDPDTTIMLASLAVCSVGLNLVVASQVILCDSWWAPAIEDQAIDRVHRLGQTKPTTVFRLVMEGSIEERVLDIQKEKRRLMMTAFREEG
ncbi:MAG: hypothetical protein M1835_001781, partial [Candelina submexicana]